MLRVNNLYYKYNGAESKVLDGIGLEIKQGELTLLTGPTGSGKSTLALLAAGILQRQGRGIYRGSITLNEKDVASLPTFDLAKKMGILFQNIDLQLFHERVAEDISFGPENLGFLPKAIHASLERELDRFGLRSYRDHRLTSLSGGYRQRVAIAGMIAMGQGCLILDEPLAFLDRSAATSLMSLLNEIKKQTGILIIEHRIDMVKGADKAFHLLEGKAIPGLPPAPDDFPSCFGPGGKVIMRVEAISYHFPGKKTAVLKDCSLELRQGTSHLLLGDNGCGKTTLLKVLSGLFKHSSGSVDIIGSGTKCKRPFPCVGLALQNPEHQLIMPTVAEEVCSFVRKQGQAKQLLSELGLEKFMSRHPQSLSRGQKKRLALAAVLAGSPRILLLDEPTVGQDPESLKLMIHALHQFVRNGGVLLSATHDFQAARSLGQVVWHMVNGRILKKGGKEIVGGYFS